MIVSRLVAKITGSVPLRPASVSLSMLAVSAEANTSAGAPSVICCTSAEEASKLNVADGLRVGGGERVADLGEGLRQ